MTTDTILLGTFIDSEHAEDAVNELQSTGYDPKDISLIMRDRVGGDRLTSTTGNKLSEGTSTGVATGAVLGGLTGLLAGIGAITIPGIGALFIAGPIATALGLTGAAATTISGALTGAFAGGLVGALVSLGIPEEEAKVYEERVREGAILVAVPLYQEKEAEARAILEDNGAEQVKSIRIRNHADVAVRHS